MLLLATAQGAAGQNIARGEALAEEYCARCHAVGLTGTSSMPPAPAFRDLSERYPIDTLWEALAEGIVTGHPAMPEFRWPPADIDDILGYIASIQAPEDETKSGSTLK
ncbi:c-type cytochrome [Afifella marina]|nr:cytochrome c [Afifella marina]